MQEKKNIQDVNIYTEFITLGDLLKYVGILSTGGAVKYFLATQRVIVNDQDEQRRGKKLYHGDLVTIVSKMSTTYRIVSENKKTELGKLSAIN